MVFCHGTKVRAVVTTCTVTSRLHQCNQIHLRVQAEVGYDKDQVLLYRVGGAVHEKSKHHVVFDHAASRRIGAVRLYVLIPGEPMKQYTVSSGTSSSGDVTSGVTVLFSKLSMAGLSAVLASQDHCASRTAQHLT